MGSPTVTPITESFHALGWLVSEADNHYSRDQATITALALKAGTILGKEISGGAGVWAAFAGNTGTGAMGTITVGSAAKVGVYKLVIIEPGTDAGKFTLEDPDGIEVGTGTVGVAFSGGGLGFTLGDATDFVSGDGGTITVTATGTKYGAFDPTATNGLQNASAILGYDTDASAADKQATIFRRHLQFNLSEIVWGANATTDAQKTVALAALAAKGMIAR